MPSVVARNKEQQVLQKALISEEPELIAIWGRRRIGKTFLVRQFFQQQIKFELSGLHDGLMSDQLEKMVQELRLRQPRKKIPTPQSWVEAFGLLELYIRSLRGKSRKVIFIDELPWLDTPRSRFMTAFEGFINSFATQRPDLMVVICGSAASWMIQHVVKNRGGLHNRVTRRLPMLPFSLAETKQFLQHRNVQLTDYDIARLYMITGGVAFYLKELERGESIAQFIDRVCFKPQGLLANEFDLLFVSLFQHASVHETIVKTLASKKMGLTRDQVLTHSGLSSGGGFNRKMDELIESGFVEEYLPFQNEKKNSLFRLVDEFSLFHLQFIHGQKRTNSAIAENLFSSSKWQSWSGFAFEGICLKHSAQIMSALNLGGISSRTYSWVGGDENGQAQIDMVIDRADNIIDICEAKFYGSPFAISKKYAGELRNKMDVFKDATKTKSNLHIVMITSFGLKQNAYAKELVNNSIELSDLFA